MLHTLNLVLSNFMCMLDCRMVIEVYVHVLAGVKRCEGFGYFSYCPLEVIDLFFFGRVEKHDVYVRVGYSVDCDYIPHPILPIKYEAQTALFKGPVRTAQ